MPSWLFPWIIAGAAVWPLLYLKRWIHKHIQGLGLLITDDPEMTVLLYYLVLLPGVVIHEVSQWLLAKLLKVKVKRFRIWPEEQKGGVVRLGLVEIDKKVDVIRTSLIGIVPLVSGTAVISLIGSTVLRTEGFIQALGSGDIPVIADAWGEMAGTPDFWLWVYLVFAIANAMLPEKHDEISWLVLVGVVVGLAAGLFLLDLGILVQASLEGFLAHAARWLSLALVMSVVIDLFFAGLIALSEGLLARLLQREIEYD